MITMRVGRRCYPGGRVIDIESAHREWVDWAVKVLERAEALEALAEAARAQFGMGAVPDQEKFTAFMLAVDALKEKP